MEGLDCHNTQQPALYTPQLDQTAQFRLTNSALPSPSNWLQRLNNCHPVILRLDWLVTCHSSLDHTALSLQRAAGQFFVSWCSDDSHFLVYYVWPHRHPHTADRYWHPTLSRRPPPGVHTAVQLYCTHTGTTPVVFTETSKHISTGPHNVPPGNVCVSSSSLHSACCQIILSLLLLPWESEIERQSILWTLTTQNMSSTGVRPMTDKPEHTVGRRGGNYYLGRTFTFNPSLKFRWFSSRRKKKLKTNANCSNEVSFELLKRLTVRTGRKHWMVFLWNWTKLVILILTTNIFHLFRCILKFQDLCRNVPQHVLHIICIWQISKVEVDFDRE